MVYIEVAQQNMLFHIEACSKRMYAAHYIFYMYDRLSCSLCMTAATKWYPLAACIHSGIPQHTSYRHYKMQCEESLIHRIHHESYKISSCKEVYCAGIVLDPFYPISHHRASPLCLFNNPSVIHEMY